METSGLKKYRKILYVLMGIVFLFFSGLFLMPKPITIEINNKEALAESPMVIETRHVSVNQTVGEVLQENGVEINDQYDAVPDVSSKATGIHKIVVTKKLPIHLIVNGNGQDVQSSADTVENVLEENGVQIGENDAVTPSCETKMTDQITEISYSSGAAAVPTDGSGTVQVADATQVVGDPIGNVLTPGQDLAQNEGQTTEKPQPTQIQNNQANGTKITTKDGVTAIASSAFGGGYSGGSGGIANTTLNSDGSLDVTSVHSYARPVDSGNPMPANYQPNDLVPVGQTQMRREAASAFEKMKEAMQRDLGVELLALSGYRSSATQATLGSLAAGANYSEHQTGLAIDLGIPNYDSIDPSDHFETTPAYSWLLANAANYGFCLSMPENTYWVAFEPWHWRFLGADLAPLVRQAQASGQCIQYTDYYPNHLYVLKK